MINEALFQKKPGFLSMRRDFSLLYQMSDGVKLSSCPLKTKVVAEEQHERVE